MQDHTIPLVFLTKKRTLPMETSVFIAKRNIFGYYSSSFAANLLKITANIAKITYPAAMTVRMFFVISTPVDGFTFELSACNEASSTICCIFSVACDSVSSCELSPSLTVVTAAPTFSGCLAAVVVVLPGCVFSSAFGSVLAVVVVVVVCIVSRFWFCRCDLCNS